MIFLSLILNLMFASSVWAGDFDSKLQCQRDDNCEVSLVGGKKQGREICRALDNPKIVMSEASYLDGELNGPFICRSFMGFVTRSGNYDKGKKSGEFRRFDAGPATWMIEYFAQDKPDKISFKTDQSFKIVQYFGGCQRGDRSISFLDCLNEKFGTFDAEVRAYLQGQAEVENKNMNREIADDYAPGQPRLRAKLVNGKYEGSYETFYKNGKLERKSEYKDGEKISEKTFFEQGQLSSESLFKSGRYLADKTYYQNGKLKMSCAFQLMDRKSKQSCIEYYDNGNKDAEYEAMVFIDDHAWSYAYFYPSSSRSFIGDVKFFDPEGALSGVRHYSAEGVLEGISWQTYRDANGQLIRLEELFAAGVLTEKSQFEGDEKKLVLKTEYFPDGSVKRVTKIDKRT